MRKAPPSEGLPHCLFDWNARSLSRQGALINTLCVVIPLLLAALGAIIAIVIVRSRKKLNEEDTSYHEIPPLNRNTDNPNDHNHMS